MEKYYNKGVDIMFLHIGDNISILKKEIVAILDKRTVEKSADTKAYIEKLIKKDCLINPSDKNISTYIITCTKKIDRKNRKDTFEYSLYTSSISSNALSKRKILDI